MTLKQIIILIIVFVSFKNLSAQSPEFKAEWAKTEKLIKQFDSLANFVQKQRIFFKSRRQKLKFYNPYNKSITHKVIIKYKNGNIIARHIYRAERKIKIKMLIVNGKKVFIKSKFKKAINSPKSYLFENWFLYSA